MPRSWVGAAAVAGFLAVALGAFGAHGLRSRVDAASLAIWETAVRYHLGHAVALLAVALYGASTERSVTAPAALWLAGLLLFSGSLYGLALGGPRWLGPVTPLGGVLLLAGWLSLFVLRR